MYGTRRQNGKRKEPNPTPSQSSSPRKPPPQKQTRLTKNTTRSKSPERRTEPKYRARQSPPQSNEELLQIVESTGDIFAAPPNTLLIHACNCDGHWGAGIAAAFASKYPKAFEQHQDHCDEHSTDLIETAQLIPPVDAFEAEADSSEETPDDALQFNIPSKAAKPKPAKHFVGCLFTSRHYGRRRDSPDRILAATAPAMVDLLRKVNAWNAAAEPGERIGEVRMCKINSGLFAVPWAKTRAVLEEIDVARSGVKVVRVISPPGN